MNILIVSPNYEPASGGIRVLHYLGYLCHLLGHRVKMSCKTINPEWLDYSQEIDQFHFRIIPEIYPATVKSTIPTVRWVLYYPGHLCGGPKTYPDHEFVVAYHEAYQLSCTNAANGRSVPIFFLPYLDMTGSDIDYPRRYLGAVWYGKGELIKPKEIAGFPIITRTWPSPRAKLIELLKSSMTFYSFDPYTSMIYEALICGCDVKIWNGNEFEPCLKKNPNEATMNIEHDLGLVENFLESIVNNFTGTLK